MPNATCPAPSCEATPTGGYLHCQKHHKRMVKYGSYDPPPKPTLQDKFWSRVEKTETCWNWTGAKNDRGYGQIRTKDAFHYAHRLSYAWANGDPLSDQIDHMCHNPSCVNPLHLRPVTNKQNQENSQVGKNNTSGYRGVSWNRRRKKWVVHVTHNYVAYSGGAFLRVEDAAEAARELRLKLFTHNLIDETERITP